MFKKTVKDVVKILKGEKMTIVKTTSKKEEKDREVIADSNLANLVNINNAINTSTIYIVKL